MEVNVGESQSETGPGKSLRPYLKINKAKRAGDVAQVVDHLSSKHKTMSSNPSTAKKQHPPLALPKTKQKKHHKSREPHHFQRDIRHSM
jgi:hypothetical protein